MNKSLSSVALATLFAFGVISAENAFAETANNTPDQSKGAALRVAASKHRRSHSFTDLGKEYSYFKNHLQDKYGLQYSVDVSFMPQYGAPNGKKTGIQTLIYPSITWQAFNNEYGNATLNLAYNIAQYSGRSAEAIGNRIGAVTGINDYTSQSNSFDELYLAYQLPGKMNWLTVGLGQFPIYNFDGTAYDSNQQENFINYALSQNASSTYPTASMGGYLQISPNEEWSLAFGAQDAHNIDGDGISTSHLTGGDAHYTSFASLTYTPTIKGLGSGEYSILYYNQPYVDVQKETTNGWSLNASQNIGEKFAVFGRINGVSGSTAEINQSYVLGAVYNNPLDRNPLDQIGFAVAYNKIDEKAVGEELAHDAETVLEAYWAWGVSKWATITPDVQFYINPALNQKSDYATVFSLRASIFF
ncbi:MAG: carbohydrate porin [Alphaproteobacteria bacterium]|nr:carbohydrate porin [Alphaproteobacteria bacterium]